MKVIVIKNITILIINGLFFLRGYWELLIKYHYQKLLLYFLKTFSHKGLNIIK